MISTYEPILICYHEPGEHAWLLKIDCLARVSGVLCQHVLQRRVEQICFTA